MLNEISSFLLKEVENLRDQQIMVAKHFNAGNISMTSYREVLIEINRAIECRLQLMVTNKD